MKPVRNVLYLVLLAFLATACGPANNVRLMPPPFMEGGVLPGPKAPRVTVVAFEDKRQDQTVIGSRRDNSAFVTSDSVTQWISKALADELARNGLQVSYADSVNQARAGNPDYLVTGDVDQVWLKENSATDLATNMRVNYALANRQGRIYSEALNASQSRTVMPLGSTADNLMLDTLRELIKPMAQKIVQAIEAKK
ncbi:LPS assembly lipoprotein LptE [Desulfovibrio sp.]|uniref:LPS assembly lipoprotein LptE n=1 Tax=Desulfovibrio sp. TaxID=885 RepID=UPI0025C13C74|nr:LPS assembly lipoprotein LptE [Desulfovibrio sp.]